jgi:hypothetical protein
MQRCSSADTLPLSSSSARRARSVRAIQPGSSLASTVRARPVSAEGVTAAVHHLGEEIALTEEVQKLRDPAVVVVGILRLRIVQPVGVQLRAPIPVGALGLDQVLPRLPRHFFLVPYSQGGDRWWRE